MKKWIKMCLLLYRAELMGKRNGNAFWTRLNHPEVTCFSLCVCVWEKENSILDSILMSFSRVFTHCAPTSEPESLTSLWRTWRFFSHRRTPSSESLEMMLTVTPRNLVSAIYDFLAMLKFTGLQFWMLRRWVNSKDVIMLS